MATKDLECLISKLSEIQKVLGGPVNLHLSKEEDEFNRAKLCLMDLVNWLSKKQDERDRLFDKGGRTVGVIKAGLDIKDKLEDAQGELQQMRDAIKRQKKNQKKFPPSQIEIKEKQLDNCIEMVKIVNDREEGIVAKEDDDDKPMTLTELKIGLHGDRNQVTHASLRKISKDEEDAIQKFREKDKELDHLIEQIDEGLGMLTKKAEDMNNHIADQEKEIEDFEIVINKTSKKMESSNAKLKKIMLEYAKPSKICMDILCFMVLLGLIGVIIKLIV
jgi:chromosome segregation ATPase